jgi:hypothetical protein
MFFFFVKFFPAGTVPPAAPEARWRRRT